MRGLKRIPTEFSLCNEVASFTDAWIETAMATPGSNRSVVASFTDAWIETGLNESKRLRYMSHLLQMRGLKLLLMTV